MSAALFFLVLLFFIFLSEGFGSSLLGNVETVVNFNSGNLLLTPAIKFLLSSNSLNINNSDILFSVSSTISSIVGFTLFSTLSNNSSQKGPSPSGNFSSCFNNVTSERVNLFATKVNFFSFL